MSSKQRATRRISPQCSRRRRYLHAWNEHSVSYCFPVSLLAKLLCEPLCTAQAQQFHSETAAGLNRARGYAALQESRLDSLQGLLQIGFEVIHILNPNGKAHEVIGDAQPLAVARRQIPVR